MGHETAIRRVIYEKHNNPDVPFNNDQVLEALNSNRDTPLDIHDIEDVIMKICESGLCRNIAQNFTTIWMKLFDVMEELSCAKCGITHVGKHESRQCPVCEGPL